ncbi:glycoside hydrolase family 16 protein [Aspergillus clavatus NRRL 1]|uniref:Crh-like protein n=1 Tax=Aspergillus clavatus (strain ATCC 1007 / CBS 513.65 / DSM 816 / NCTC 3887 / NRRL 1 / QM 1276 / 107) TaxID=344612 RepID=A1CT89_ASPCL|nr:cell wall glucanase, putative [Aspergillus clavatus NRRL 1]EAW06526.1 cell wall glucanase, putative [Aspergillus clavatus NRRL 1]
MRFSLVGVAIGLLSTSTHVVAQTYTNCNPLQKTCPADPALGRSVSYDFTQGPSSDFSAIGSPTYDGNGAAFTVAKQGDSPLIQSNWYMMFGHVDFVIKTAPGTGIVSSAVLQSDDLDEIDWEWLGGNNAYVQTNYFGKGDTGSYSRGATHDNPGNHDGFHTYTIDWTSKQIVWQIDGKTVRVLTPETAAENQYPQSPMMVKVGVWAGGDPRNAQGTIQWAGGETDYSAGPYTMYLKSLVATDYSTGKSYTYSDNSGSWQSITSEGGQINGNSDAESISTVESAPPVTATIDTAPIPFSGTHRETSIFVTPSVYPWVPRPTTFASSVAKQTTLPSGWTFSGARQVQPPSAASSFSPSTSASSVSLSVSVVSFSPSAVKTSFVSSRSASIVTLTTHRSSAPKTKVHNTPAGPTISSSQTFAAQATPSIAAAHGLIVPVRISAWCALLGGIMAIA